MASRSDGRIVHGQCTVVASDPWRRYCRDEKCASTRARTHRPRPDRRNVPSHSENSVSPQARLFQLRVGASSARRLPHAPKARHAPPLRRYKQRWFHLVRPTWRRPWNDARRDPAAGAGAPGGLRPKGMWPSCVELRHIAKPRAPCTFSPRPARAQSWSGVDGGDVGGEGRRGSRRNGRRGRRDACEGRCVGSELDISIYRTLPY